SSALNCAARLEQLRKMNTRASAPRRSKSCEIWCGADGGAAVRTQNRVAIYKNRKALRRRICAEKSRSDDCSRRLRGSCGTELLGENHTAENRFQANAPDARRAFFFRSREKWPPRGIRRAHNHGLRRIIGRRESVVLRKTSGSRESRATRGAVAARSRPGRAKR